MNSRKAFTLVELLSVMVIMVLLSALVIPTIKTSKAGLVSTAGSHITSMLESARQTAILNRQPVAVVMLQPDSNSIQRFTAFKFVPVTSGTGGSWTQISKWDPLPTGILADPNASFVATSGTVPCNAFQPTNSPVLSPALPTLTYPPGGSTTYTPRSNYGYVVFMPDGSLYLDSSGSPTSTLTPPCIVRIVEGISNSGAITYTGLQNAGQPSNYCDIVINDATGEVKLVRP